ncbi:hypothetical protein EDI_132290 [Entamoeba dispar SAW760]|uniref:Uncharacterized protein n=1 Tax=Entamoeba dispar (strain ATCC PRA-260 / SAW760) TaxID=370354 RepID=B0EHI4_ENTDS|nr:uncharacterized protein EDI_132290 [Entamoeba dispar SAW760]EDR26011.1 hypothetical protein EDI_132290 [Entamoeba dispar SAW760]|eukprot:EDR26011.1 hypothetical protein EDI_132290 [Entamoeba dispar SAW760]
MRSIILFLLLLSVIADDEFYHFRHGCIMHRRMVKAQKMTEMLEKKLKQTRKIERRILHELELNYEDTEMATTRKDKVLLQQTIRKLQFQLRKTRNAKVEILRKLRKVADSLTGVERGRMIRRNRLEEYVDYHGSDISKEYRKVNKQIYEMEKKYAVEYAKEAAKLAAKNTYSQIQEAEGKDKPSEKDIKHQIASAAKEIYERVYTEIIHIIRRNTLHGGNMKRIEENTIAEIKVYMESIKAEFNHEKGKLEATQTANKKVNSTTSKSHKK